MAAEQDVHSRAEEVAVALASRMDADDMRIVSCQGGDNRVWCWRTGEFLPPSLSNGALEGWNAIAGDRSIFDVVDDVAKLMASPAWSHLRVIREPVPSWFVGGGTLDWRKAWASGSAAPFARLSSDPIPLAVLEGNGDKAIDTAVADAHGDALLRLAHLFQEAASASVAAPHLASLFVLEGAHASEWYSLAIKCIEIVPMATFGLRSEADMGRYVGLCWEGRSSQAERRAAIVDVRERDLPFLEGGDFMVESRFSAPRSAHARTLPILTTSSACPIKGKHKRTIVRVQTHGPPPASPAALVSLVADSVVRLRCAATAFPVGPRGILDLCGAARAWTMDQLTMLPPVLRPLVAAYVSDWICDAER